MEQYLNVFVSGYNVNVLVFGNGHSEKSKIIEGGRQQEGLVEIFVEQLYSKLEGKRNNAKSEGRTYSYYITFGAVEIVDEAVHDLLGGPGCKIEEDQWEGPKIIGAVEY